MKSLTPILLLPVVVTILVTSLFWFLLQYLRPMITSNWKLSNVVLLIYKFIAVIMTIGSICGIRSNVSYLQRYGFSATGGGFAVAGVVVACGILMACIHILRLPFLKCRRYI